MIDGAYFSVEFNAYIAKRELRQVAGVLKREITRSYKLKLSELTEKGERHEPRGCKTQEHIHGV